ncbi:MAG: hypothetical protein K8R79_00145 [Calditrichales bacterium]|nr:hypothetical protein [Calditrichales bacterium]
MKIIKQTLESGEDVLISDFGKFYVKKNGNEKCETQSPAVICCWRPRRLLLLGALGN